MAVIETVLTVDKKANKRFIQHLINCVTLIALLSLTIQIYLSYLGKMYKSKLEVKNLAGLEAYISAAKKGAFAACEELPKATIAVEKNKGDFATSADLQSQAAIISELSRLNINIPLVAEESEAPSQLPSSYITIDPFDGTIMGSRGANNWGILISEVQDYQAQKGVLYQPCLDLLIAAEKNQGVFLLQAKENLNSLIHFQSESQRRLQDGIVIAFDINYTTTQKHIEQYLIPLLNTGKVLVARGLCAAVANTADLLLGKVDAYINPSGGKIWDYAPGACAVKEAGGACYSFHGPEQKPYPFRCDELAMSILFASSDALAKDILEVWGKTV